MYTTIIAVGSDKMIALINRILNVLLVFMRKCRIMGQRTVKEALRKVEEKLVFLFIFGILFYVGPEAHEPHAHHAQFLHIHCVAS